MRNPDSPPQGAGRGKLCSYIEQGELVVEYRGRRLQPPFREQLLVRTRPGSEAVAEAAVFDAAGHEVERFRSTLEEIVRRQAEVAVLARAERLVDELNGALEEGRVALQARDLLRGPPPVEEKSRPVLAAPPVSAPAPVVHRSHSPTRRWADSGLDIEHLAALLLALLLGGAFLLNQQIADELPTAHRYQVESVPLSLEDSVGRVAVMLASSVREGHSVARLEERLQTVAGACGVEVVDKQPIWKARYGERTVGGPGPNWGGDPVPQGVEAKYRVPAETQAERRERGLPLDLESCALLKGEARFPYLEERGLGALEENLALRVSLLAEAEADFYAREGRYGSAKEVNAQALRTGRIQTGVERWPATPGRGEGVRVWARVPRQYHCEGWLARKPEAGSAPFWELRCGESRRRARPLESREAAPPPENPFQREP